MKFSIIFGTRPEIIKLSPVIRELDRRKINYILIHTGQHNLKDLMNELNIRQPDIILDIPPITVGKFRGNIVKGISSALLWSLKIIKKISEEIRKLKVDVVFYQGDTLAIACASISAKIFSTPPLTGHIEAGLRTYNWLEPFPEEISRRIADRFSDLLFAPTEENKKNLKREFVKGKIYVTGNTIVDAILQNLRLIKKVDMKLPKNYVLVLVHRQENIHSKRRLENLIKIMEEVDEKFIFISHDSTTRKLRDFNLLDRLKRIKNLEMYPLLSYLKFLKLVVNADCVISDSGGLQEETCILKKPCIVWRMATERTEAIDAGTAVLSYCDKNTTLNYLNDIKNRGEFYEKVKKSKNPFGDGKAAKRIIDITLSNL
jgi:UDP-N-acetylglucosamine 2-epimerase (non-hydrolysing)